VADPWELIISSERRGQAGRRPLVAKTYRLPGDPGVAALLAARPLP
jgi:hypothetical protein